MNVDSDILGAALIGYQQRKGEIEASISDLQRRLDVVSDSAPTNPVVRATKRRRMSAAGRARISAAMKKRWAAKNKA